MAASLAAGCTEYEGLVLLPHDPSRESEPLCSIPEGEIVFGASRDGIPALTNPRVVQPSDAEAEYLEGDDRVIGIRAGADVVAIPLRIMWYHEIVNIDLAGRAFAITHCPLTGSSLAFERESLDDVEFGVSGLLYRSNLIMYDRESESLWPQLSRGARCGVRKGTSLSMHPVIETTWSSWLEMHPHTWVLSSETGYDRRYQVNPYGDYGEIEDVFYPVTLDSRRPAKERVLGVVGESGGVAYPFGELERLGAIGVVTHAGATSAEGGTVVFWDADARAAMAYSRVVDGTELTFAVEGDRIVDMETNSAWRVDGVATSGPLAGSVLEPVAEAYVAYWFGWAAFEPGATLWESPDPDGAQLR